MNKIIKQIFLPLILVLLMGSCNDDVKYYTLDIPSDKMKLSASSDSLILEKVDESKEAVTFTWNDATDRGAGTRIVYYFRLYHAEMTNLESELIKIDEGTRSITWSVRELNNLLHSWNIAPGEEVPVEAEILAVVESSSQYMKPEVSKTQVKVVGYDTSNKLFLAATVAGQLRNIEMTMLSEGIYTWAGELDVSTFKFVRDADKGAPAYLKGADDNTLEYSSSGEGISFSITEPKYYIINVDLNKLEIKITSLPAKLYMITVKDGIEQTRSLTRAEAGRSIFYLKEKFEEGTEFRFAENDKNNWPAYVKGNTGNNLELKNEGAEMFKVSKTATYVMTVNIEDMSLIFLDVYVSPTGSIAVVGDAVTATNGWDAGLAIQNCILLQKDLINKPEVISYTGKFEYKASGSQNSFKFTGDRNWGSGLFAPKANANPFNPDELSVSTSSSGDKKWTLPSGTESGTYTLELNLHTMKINLIK